MNELCKCGKPPHAGGCRLPPETDEERARKAAEPHFTPMCQRGPDPAYGPRIDPKNENAIKQYSVESQLPFDPGPLHMDPTMYALLVDCAGVQATKGHDYTSGSPDRLANFRQAGEAAGITTKQAWFVYFFKHYKAIETYVSYGQVESEPIRGRILDCINYLLLLELIREEEAIPKT